MHRGRAEAFASDPLARATAGRAIDRGFDQLVRHDRRPFFYLPFEHSEDLADQRRSLLLFTALGSAEHLNYAKKHYDVIEKFGRFPHRNAILGRKPTALEAAAGDVVPW